MGDGQGGGQRCGQSVGAEPQQCWRPDQAEAAARRGRGERVRGHERSSRRPPRLGAAVQWGQSLPGICGK